mmetsp:Transcript_24348/g.59608  ORF Transcript_24348/g.59608 Transcript_24348/m.59608 type:complete len:471 (-) Transcript_24348:394-1806(-)
MPFVKLIDDADNAIFADDDGSNHRLPVGVSLIEIRNEDHNSDPNCRRYDYETILELIEQSPNKSEICVNGIGEWSPEYLALLAQIMKHCDKLYVSGLSGDLAYGCFAGALIHHDGLRELTIDFCAGTPPMSSNQAKLVFAGVASSSSLEKLELLGRFADNEAASRSLIEAIQKNSSLKSLDLFVTSNNHAGFVKTALLETRIQHLRVGDFAEMPWEIPLDELAELLCREDCVLESLSLGGQEPIPPSGSLHGNGNEQLAIKQNTSVTSLTLDCTTGARLGDTLGVFKSLVKLDLWYKTTSISGLDPLYPLLIGDNLTLESLILGGLSPAMAEHVAILFCKLPLMTCLRELDIYSTSFRFESSWWMTILGLTLWQNKSLECFYFENIKELEFDSRLRVPLSLNRGGRRAMEVGSPKELPENLWPLILERASQIHYYDFGGTLGEPKLESTRVDVVYWLLKEKVLGRYPSMS